MTSTGSSTGFSTPSAPLKRLGPVRENATFYSSKSTEIASSLYSTLKQYAPKNVMPQIHQIEETISSYSYPAFAKLQDRSDSVLKSLDGQVDYVAKQAGGYYGNASSTVSSTHKDNMHRFHSSRETYYSKVQEAVEYVKAHGITGAAKSTADSLLAQIDYARKTSEKQASFATEKVKEAWTNFQQLPIVQKILHDASSVSGFAWQKYMNGHDAVLGHPTYHRAYKGSMDSVSSLQGTTLYQRAKTQLYPSVAPYADPALDKISTSSYYRAAVAHLKPVQSNGRLT